MFPPSWKMPRICRHGPWNVPHPHKPRPPWAVAHAMAQYVWSPEGDGSDNRGGGGVYQALMEERGCWMEPHAENAEAPENVQEEKKSGGGFTSALLDALDEDLGGPPPPPSSSTKTPPRSGNVSSGNFLSALTGLGGGGSGGGVVEMRLMQMQAKFCVMNGIQAASGACQSLGEYLDDLILSLQEEEEQPPELDTVPLPNNNDDKATAMIRLAREELFRYKSIYEQTLQQKVSEVITEYCIVADDGQTPLLHGHGLCLDHVASFVAHETYDFTSGSELQKLETDERLESELMAPLKAFLFLQQMAPRCEYHVLSTISQDLTSRLVEMILTTLWTQRKRFTDWGSLLFSKQVRLIQTYLQECLTPVESPDGTMDAGPPDSSGGGGVVLLMEQWERLTQVVALLQMEKPAEWLLYHGSGSTTGVLTPDQVAQTMHLRVDFSPDAIRSVVDQYAKAMAASKSSSGSLPESGLNGTV